MSDLTTKITEFFWDKHTTGDKDTYTVDRLALVLGNWQTGALDPATVLSSLNYLLAQGVLAVKIDDDYYAENA